MKIGLVIKKSLPILNKVKLNILFSIVLSLVGAISGGLSIGLIIPLIDKNSEEIFNELGVEFLTNLVSNDLITNESDRIRFLAIMIILFTLFEAITTIFSGFIGVSISSKITKNIQYRLLRKHFLLEQKYADKQDPGYLLSVFSSSSQNIGFLFGQILAAVKNIFIILIYSYALFMVSIQMTIGAFLLLGIMSTILKAYFGKKLKKQSEKTIESLEIFNGALVESIRNIKFIKTSGRWIEFENRLQESINNFQKNHVKRSNINMISSPLFNSFNATSIALLLIAGTYIIDQPIEDWIPLMVPFVIIVFRLAAPINSLNSLRIRIEGMFPDFVKVLNFLDESKGQVFKDGDKEFENLKKEIKFVDLEFSYGENFKLRNINISFKAFTSTALVGPSGGGKSTIIDILLRMYEFDRGEVLLDNMDIKQFVRSSMHKNIAYVSQEPVMFNTSIINNLKWFNPDASYEDVVEATKKAQIYDFINSLDGKFEHKVLNQGTNFSGGQKQRIAIARAILSNASIIIFDEATSQIDIGSESEIYKIIDNLKSTATIIFVAHRLSALKNIDKIYIVQDGTVTSSGNHEDLLKFSNFYSDSLNQ